VQLLSTDVAGTEELVSTDFDQIDFFSDESLNEDPYPFYDHLRSKCPVTALPNYGVLAVSGYDEASDVYRDPDTFSSCNSVVGPFATFPVPPEGDDVTEIVAAHRDQLPMHDHMVTMDPPDHTQVGERGDGADLPQRLEVGVRVVDQRLVEEEVGLEQLGQRGSLENGLLT
jgi:hypothetical protein